MREDKAISCITLEVFRQADVSKLLLLLAFTLHFYVIGINPMLSLFVSGQELIRVTTFYLIIISIFCYLHALFFTLRPRRYFRILPVEIPIFLQFAVAMFSVGWTTRPFSALGYIMLTFAYTITISLLFRMEPSGKWIKYSLYGIVLGGLNIALVTVLFFGIKYGMSSIQISTFDYFHKNQIGRLIASSIVLALPLILYKKNTKIMWKYILIIITIFCGYCLLYVFSKTNIVAVTLAVICMFLAGRNKLVNWFLLMSVFLLILLAIGPFLYKSWILYYNKYFMTLTGRTIIWSKTWEWIKAKPLLGYGHYSFRDLHVTDIPVVFIHNDLLQQLFSYGIIGLIPFIWWWYFIFKSTLKILKSEVQLLIPKETFIGILVFFILHALLDSCYFSFEFILISYWLQYLISYKRYIIYT